MTSFRIKQVGLAICLMASLAIGSVAACMCSHHKGKVEKAETSCHGSHEPAPEKVEVRSTGGDAFDASCSCFLKQPNPVIVSKSENKKNRPDKNTPAIDQPTPALESIEVTAGEASLPRLERLLFYSNVLTRLLPSRAPPRL